MKDQLKRLGLLLSLRLDQISYYLGFFNWKRIDQTAVINKQNQILLSLKYRELSRMDVQLPRFDEVEFRSFSQHGEDGILLYIFALIGTTTRRVVEVCAGDGVECNAANLIINHDWQGLLFDGNLAKIRFGRAYYARNLNTLQQPPALVNAWIDAEHIDELIRSNGMQGEIDLLSLDMDGVDYWVCKAITCVSPRVIVVEYNACLGSQRAVSVPYRSDFNGQSEHWGASLPAFVKLLREKGYRLVGCEQSGINAFFVRSGIAEDLLPEIQSTDSFARTRARQIYERLSTRAIQHEWVDL